MSHIHSNTRAAMHDVQAHLVRAAKSEDGKTRNWALFFFFRIMTRAELRATLTHIQQLRTDLETDPNAWSNPSGRRVFLDFSQPGFSSPHTRARSARNARTPSSLLPGDPSPAFLNFLSLTTGGDETAFRRKTDQLRSIFSSFLSNDLPAKGCSSEDISRLSDLVAGAVEGKSIDYAAIPYRMAGVLAALEKPASFLELLTSFGKTWEEAGENALDGGLPLVAVYEMLREAAPTLAREVMPEYAQGLTGAVRSAAEESRYRTLREYSRTPFDTAPITLAFSYPGLQALKLDPATLSSFPDPFKQGMAARAERLQDTGPSDPATWETEFGLPSVHGYFSGGFAVPPRIKEALWAGLRDDIEAFNQRLEGRGTFLRAWIGLVFRLLGMEIVHIELGQDPYDLETVNGVTETVPLPDRYEHFGFRDGISQPFVDLGLGQPPLGGGTPGPNGVWTPVAPGEIYLDMPDEDGETHELPINKTLRHGGTFVVFRKLEQDVTGFRAFLAAQHPGESEAQGALAAQFVGRWQNGAPLARAPFFPSAATTLETNINDFRYASEDPDGLRCPLGAHIRRANPRDIGASDGVRRHRILRRGISYGGPLLAAEAQLGDGKKRGLLFIAVNARIDLQFEVVHSDWLNNGEFLGQAGLGRCPLTGAHEGTVFDSFLERGQAAPLTGIPRFVVTRGGDYFFAPGVEALKEMAKGNRFEPATGGTPFSGRSMGDCVTPSLFDPNLVGAEGLQILDTGWLRIKCPPTPQEETQDVVVVAQRNDLHEVLKLRSSAADPLVFPMLQYHQASQRLARGQDLIIAADPRTPYGERLREILQEGWNTYQRGLKDKNTETAVRCAARTRLDQALRSANGAIGIDLVNQLAAQACHGVLCEVYGTPGPEFLTEIVPAIQFARQHIGDGDLPADWLRLLSGQTPADPRMTTIQWWATLILGDLASNPLSLGEIAAFSSQAGAEMLVYLDQVLTQARARHGGGRLMDAYVGNERMFTQNPKWGYSPGADGVNEYYRDVEIVMLEIAGTTMAAIPLVFACIMETLLDLRIDLADLIPHIDRADTSGGLSGVQRLIYEAERLNPATKYRMRGCAAATQLRSGATVNQGDLVAIMCAAANLDPEVFADPSQFSLAPYLPGPVRNQQSYILFGDQESDAATVAESYQALSPDTLRRCWGRDRVAMVVLEECVRSAGQLRGLRTVAGPSGVPRKLYDTTLTMPARFTQVVPRG